MRPSPFLGGLPITITVTAVVPVARVDAMLRRGWRSGRTNGFTTTLEHDFQTEGEAYSAAERLPRTAVWSLNGEWKR